MQARLRTPIIFLLIMMLAPVLPGLADDARTGPGDYREGYDEADFRTQSRRLVTDGKALDLVALAESPPAGLPAVPIPEQNPLNV